MLTAAEVQAVLDGCEHLRDRLLFAVLLDCGVRIGEALGLRHEDMGIADRTVAIVPRANDSGARAKAGIARTIPASRMAGRGPMPRSMTWCCGCGNGPGSISGRISEVISTKFM